MDHQLLGEILQNYARRRDLPIDPAETFEKMKLEKGRRSYYQDDHHVRYKDERRFGHVKGVDCPDQLQQYLLRLKRAQQNSTSGMQAVFLSGFHPRSHSSSRSAGTGVFLPPGTVNEVEPTRKPGCSTVLLPVGVIQALKLHFDSMNGRRIPISSSVPAAAVSRHGKMQWQTTGIVRATPDRDDDFRRKQHGGSRTWMRAFFRGGFTDGSNRRIRRSWDKGS